MIIDSNINKYLKKIIFLEKAIGYKTTYNMLEPFYLNSKDPISIQNSAKKIADFIGLNGYTILVVFDNLNKTHAGNIELNHSSDVIINISREIMDFQEAILGTLCHEITHKFLQINGINAIDENEDEILTDITAVYLGLGKLMLCGCENKKVTSKYVGNETQTTTSTLKIGYINLIDLVQIYFLVCKMRNLSIGSIFTGLSDNAYNEVEKYKQSYADLYDLYKDSNTKDTIILNLNKRVRDFQVILSNIDRNLIYIHGKFTEEIEIFLSTVHKYLFKVIADLKRKIEHEEYNPCLRYLEVVELDFEVEKVISEINSFSKRAKMYNELLFSAINFINGIDTAFNKPVSEMFCTSICRNCGQEISILKNKSEQIVNCSKCNYQFIADSSLPNIQTSKNSKVGLLRRMLNKK